MVVHWVLLVCFWFAGETRPEFERLRVQHRWVGFIFIKSEGRRCWLGLKKMMTSSSPRVFISSYY